MTDIINEVSEISTANIENGILDVLSTVEDTIGIKPEPMDSSREEQTDEGSVVCATYVFSKKNHNDSTPTSIAKDNYRAIEKRFGMSIELGKRLYRKVAKLLIAEIQNCTDMQLLVDTEGYQPSEAELSVNVVVRTI